MEMECIRHRVKPTAEVPRPLDVIYSGDYSPTYRREIPKDLLPHTCKLCGESIADWRVTMGFDVICADCQSAIDELSGKPKAKQLPKWKPSDMAQIKALLRGNPHDSGRTMQRKAKYCVERTAARAGVDMLSRVSRQSLREATADCVAEYLRSLAVEREKGRTINHWRSLWFAAKHTLRRYVISSDSASFGALVPRPLVPMGFRPVSSYELGDGDTLARITNELRPILAGINIDIADCDIWDAIALVRSELPDIWRIIELRLIGS